MPANRQRIVWTALPRGLTPATPGQPRRLNLWVHVGPRLEPQAGVDDLAPFPDFVHWPAHDLTFSVVLHQGPLSIVVGPPQVIRVSPTMRQDLWDALFSTATPLEPFLPVDLGARTVHSFSAEAIHDEVRRLWGQVGARGPTYPPVDWLLSPERYGRSARRWIGKQQPEGLSDFARLSDAHAESKLAVEHGEPVPADRLALQRELVRLLRFYLPPSGSTSQPSDAPLKIPTLDFHAMLSMLGNHPHLAELLGLIHHLHVRVPSVDLSTITHVSVRVDWTSESDPVVTVAGPKLDVCPRTRVTVSSSAFRAVANDATVDSGLLALHQPDSFSTLGVDVDGGGMKITEFVTTLQRMQAFNSQDTPSTAMVPTLRTGGISIIRSNRAEQFTAHQAAIAGHHSAVDAGDSPELFADDLVRGLRIDVWDDTSLQWRSLCERTAGHLFTRTGNSVDDVVDEGFVSTSIRSHGPVEDPATELYLQESLFEWNGWSLVARAPGAPLAARAKAGEPLIEEPIDAPDSGLDSVIRALPGSLPRLRFGRRYRFRARTVDVAGQSLSVEAATARTGTPDTDNLSAVRGGVSAAIRHGRFDPIPPPTLLLTSAPGDGETADTLVVRSEGASAPITTDVAARHLVPERGAVKTAEQHGMFDHLTAGARAALWHTLEEKALLKEAPTGEGPLKAALQESAIVSQLDSLPYPADPAGAGALLFTRERGSRGWELFWGAEFQTLATVDFAIPQSWPGASICRLELFGLSENADATAAIVDGMTIRVGIPAARVLDAYLASYIAVPKPPTPGQAGPPTLDHMGLWSWIESEAAGIADGGETLDWLRGLAIEGKLWLLCPRRRIEFVHAVRRPLHAPIVSGVPLALGRDPGAATARVAFNLTVDDKSTVQVELVGRWREWVDTGTGNPTTSFDNAIPTEHSVYKRTIAYDHVGQYAKPTTYLWTKDPGHPRTHVLPDTRYRRVTYSAIGISRYAEFFGLAVGDAESSLETPPDKRRSVDVLSCARPSPPAVHSVVPYFEWITEDDGSRITRTRRGNGLRVYLNRPWWSSGQGELLGVLFADGVSWEDLEHATPSRGLLPYVTRWGLDPTVSGETGIVPLNRPDTRVTANNFPRSHTTTSGLQLAELAGEEGAPTVAVAGHAVEYDKTLDLWFSDIEIRPDTTERIDSTGRDAYFPFVRLALARYQPMSIDGLYLSRVYLADFAQLAPDRTATVERDSDSPRDIHVGVEGPSLFSSAVDASGGTLLRGTPRVTAHIEVFDPSLAEPGATDDALAWLPLPSSAKDAHAELSLVSMSTVLPTTDPFAEPMHVSTTRWRGVVRLPSGAPSAPKQRFRVAIRELERWRGDVELGQPEWVERIVYADAIEVP